MAVHIESSRWYLARQIENGWPMFVALDQARDHRTFEKVDMALFLDVMMGKSS